MPTTAVYNIRIPSELRKVMEEMQDVDWQEEIRETVEELIREKNKKRLLAEAEELIKEQKTEVDVAKIIREDRDAR